MRVSKIKLDYEINMGSKANIQGKKRLPRAIYTSKSEGGHNVMAVCVTSSDTKPDHLGLCWMHLSVLFHKG